MAYETENTLEKREARVAAAMRFEEGDRVPFAPRMGTIYSEMAGVSPFASVVSVPLTVDP